MSQVKRLQRMTPAQPKSVSVATSPARPVGVRGYRVRNVAKAAERHREILTGAARAFARSGYDATNMDQIAHECGLAKGHIYHYFRGKEEIFNEIRTDQMSRAIEQLAPIVPGSSTDPELALKKAISFTIARVLREGGRYEQMLATPVSLGPENRKLLRTLSRRYEQMFATILRSGMDKGVFVAGDPKLMTFVILRGAITVANWYREGGKWKPQWIIEQVTEQLVRSVRRPGR
jgi:TetR/AcrR family transcriptional regulator, cholesterol catabolism regulator